MVIIDNPSPGSSTLAVTDRTTRTSTAESVTTTFTPSSFEMMTLMGESLAATIGVLEASANSGTNYFDFGNVTELAPWVTSMGAVSLGAASRIRYTTPATVGTYITALLGSRIGSPIPVHNPDLVNGEFVLHDEAAEKGRVISILLKRREYVNDPTNPAADKKGRVFLPTTVEDRIRAGIDNIRAKVGTQPEVFSMYHCKECYNRMCDHLGLGAKKVP